MMVSQTNMRICLSIFYKHFSTLTPTHFFAVKVLRTVETNTDKDTINQNKNSLTQSHNKLEKETTYIQHEKTHNNQTTDVQQINFYDILFIIHPC